MGNRKTIIRKSIGKINPFLKQRGKIVSMKFQILLNQEEFDVCFDALLKNAKDKVTRKVKKVKS